MKLVTFGGPLGDVYDPVSRLVLHPSVTGEAMLPPDYPEELLPGAAACLTRHTTNAVLQAFSEGRGHPMGGDGPPWKAEIDAAGAGASAELRAAIRFGSFTVTFSKEDQPKVAAARRQAVIDRMQGPAQGQGAPATPDPVAGTLPGGMPPPVVSPPVVSPPAVAPAFPMVPAAPAGSSKARLIIVLVGGVFLLGIVGGVAWYFTHSHAHAHAAPPAHEREHGRGKHE